MKKVFFPFYIIVAAVLLIVVPSLFLTFSSDSAKAENNSKEKTEGNTSKCELKKKTNR